MARLGGTSGTTGTPEANRAQGSDKEREPAKKPESEEATNGALASSNDQTSEDAVQSMDTSPAKSENAVKRHDLSETHISKSEASFGLANVPAVDIKADTVQVELYYIIYLV